MTTSRRRATLAERIIPLRAEKRLIEWRWEHGERKTDRDRERREQLHYRIANLERQINDLPVEHGVGMFVRKTMTGVVR